jgi:hypothetical protein
MNAIVSPHRKARKEARRQIRSEISRRFDEERKRSGAWHRFVIWWTIERQVSEELKRRFPPHALYVNRVSNG